MARSDSVSSIVQPTNALPFESMAALGSVASSPSREMLSGLPKTPPAGR
jgi:hypothetical protein